MLIKLLIIILIIIILCNYSSSEKFKSCPIVTKTNKGYYVNVPKKSSYVDEYGSGNRFLSTSRENARNLYSAMFSDCPIPHILKTANHRKLPPNCPFSLRESNPCYNSQCSNVKWNDKIPTLNNTCKRNVSYYCHENNNLDPACKCWNPKYKNTKKCKKIINHIDNIPNFNNWVKKETVANICPNCVLP